MSFLPFAWIGEQMLAVACGLRARPDACPSPRTPRPRRADLREIGPERDVQPAAHLGVDALARCRSASTRPAGSSGAVFGWATTSVTRSPAAGSRASGPASCCAWRTAWPTPWRCVRCATSWDWPGSSAATPAARRSARTSSVSSTPSASTSSRSTARRRSAASPSMHRDDAIAFHTVGTPIPGTQMRIDRRRRDPAPLRGVFRGYLRQPDATAETVDADGWLHTGDAGYLDEAGQLVVIDRAKDVLQTARRQPVLQRLHREQAEVLAVRRGGRRLLGCG